MQINDKGVSEEFYHEPHEPTRTFIVSDTFCSYNKYFLY